MEIVSNKIANVSAQVADHRLQWDVVAALMGGTAAMRLGGTKFLPMQPNEERVDWEVRRDRTTLDNFYGDGVDRIVSKVFAKSIKFDELPLPLSLLLEDFDNQQQNATQVAAAVFHDAANFGIGYLLTDYPSLPEGKSFENYAAERAAGRRPYQVRISPLSLLDVRSSQFNGSERLSLFRYMETVSRLSTDNVSEDWISQVREYRQSPAEDGSPGLVECLLYRKNDAGNWYLYSGTPLGLSAISVTPVYGKQSTFYLGRPPLFDLAEQNIHHWQLSSDLNNILHVCNVPFLLVKGFTAPVDQDGNDTAGFEINIRKAVLSANENASISWIEHTGQTIKVAMENIERLEKRMEARAMTAVTQKPGGVTATATAINAAEANADLKQMALALQDALNAALYYMSLYMGLQTYGRCEVNTSFSNDYVSEATFDAVLQMFAAGLINRDTVISESKRRNILAIDQDVPPVAQTATSTANQKEALPLGQ